MKAWVFVEGQSDRLGLEALWKSWRERLRLKRHGIAVIPLYNKTNFLKKFGQRAAEKLLANESDLVVGLPDLYPTGPFANSAFAHASADDLKRIQKKRVEDALAETHGIRADHTDILMARMYPSVFKHDFEMLLLAAHVSLRAVLGTSERLGNWRIPVEEQDLFLPPKRVVEELFRAKSSSRRCYLDTRDSPSILGKVTDVAGMLRTETGQPTCPEFVAVLRWLGERFDESCCDLP